MPYWGRVRPTHARAPVIRPYLFPLAFGLNGFSLSFLVVVSGLSGASGLAADLSLAQASMIAVFFSLSANARNLILKGNCEELDTSLSQMRLIMAPLLAGMAFFLSTSISKVPLTLASAIVLRQAAEWFSELELARDERAGRQRAAQLYVFLSVPALAAAVSALLLAPGFFPGALFLWALAPIPYCAPGIWRICRTLGHVSIHWHKLLPNYASTVIIGTVVLFFRLLIAGFTGKETAGQLFTAFAIGSLIGSIYDKTIGPSLMVSSSLSAAKKLIFRGMWLVPAAGACLVIFLASAEELPAYLLSHLTLFAALGFSLIGGFIMLGAQQIKISLLHSSSRDDVFMGDLISNFSILMSVPVVFLLFGENAFVLLFLINSILVYFGYWLISGRVSEKMPRRGWVFVRYLTAFSVVTPVFVQLSSGIYRGRLEVYDWGGALGMLPLPLSVFLCFPLILMLHSLRGFKFFSIFTFVTFCTMMLGTVLSSSGDSLAARDKILLSMQCLLPFFGLVLAEHSAGGESFLKILAKVFLWVSVSIAAMQVFAAGYAGSLRLSPYLWVFSVYNNSQYVSVIMVSAYIFALLSLSPSGGSGGWRSPLFYAPLLALYVALSWSMLSIALLILGLAVFVRLNGLDRKVISMLAACVLMFALVAGIVRYHGGDFALMKLGSHPTVGDLRQRRAALQPSESAPANPPALTAQLPRNVMERVEIWRYYWEAVKSAGVNGMVFGHPKPPPRAVYPSAHNYYLDILYNFGLLTLLPVLGLVSYTLILLFKARRLLSGNGYAAGLVLVVLFFLLVENAFKVGLRQPYSGLYSFFLWGLLISFLRQKISGVTIGAS